MKSVKEETKKVISDIVKLNDGHNHTNDVETSGTEIEEAKQAEKTKIE